MNGKKAKQLRKLAGPAMETDYTVQKGSTRNKFMNLSPMIDAHGLPMFADDHEDGTEGEQLFNRINWTTSTIMMATGTRMVYKVLKNIYHNRTRDLPINIHTPVGA